MQLHDLQQDALLGRPGDTGGVPPVGRRGGAGGIPLPQQARRHAFCKRCGIHTFTTGDSPRMGPLYAVALACLDDLPAEELARAPVTYLDGRNDNWSTPPAETRHL
jgi:hypothetical protein